MYMLSLAGFKPFSDRHDQYYERYILRLKYIGNIETKYGSDELSGKMLLVRIVEDN